MCCCECTHHGRYGRRFFTKEEEANKLKEYAEELKKELSVVEEQIKELKS